MVLTINDQTIWLIFSIYHICKVYEKSIIVSPFLFYFVLSFIQQFNQKILRWYSNILSSKDYAEYDLGSAS